jgi:hypothetical protein
MSDDTPKTKPSISLGGIDLATLIKQSPQIAIIILALWGWMSNIQNQMARMENDLAVIKFKVDMLSAHTASTSDQLDGRVIMPRDMDVPHRGFEFPMPHPVTQLDNVNIGFDATRGERVTKGMPPPAGAALLQLTQGWNFALQQCDRFTAPPVNPTPTGQCPNITIAWPTLACWEHKQQMFKSFFLPTQCTDGSTMQRHSSGPFAFGFPDSELAAWQINITPLQLAHLFHAHAGLECQSDFTQHVIFFSQIVDMLHLTVGQTDRDFLRHIQRCNPIRWVVLDDAVHGQVITKNLDGG